MAEGGVAVFIDEDGGDGLDGGAELIVEHGDADQGLRVCQVEDEAAVGGGGDAAAGDVAAAEVPVEAADVVEVGAGAAVGGVYGGGGDAVLGGVGGVAVGVAVCPAVIEDVDVVDVLGVGGQAQGRVEVPYGGGAGAGVGQGGGGELLDVGVGGVGDEVDVEHVAGDEAGLDAAGVAGQGVFGGGAGGGGGTVHRLDGDAAEGGDFYGEAVGPSGGVVFGLAGGDEEGEGEGKGQHEEGGEACEACGCVFQTVYLFHIIVPYYHIVILSIVILLYRCSSPSLSLTLCRKRNVPPCACLGRCRGRGAERKLLLACSLSLLALQLKDDFFDDVGVGHTLQAVLLLVHHGADVALIEDVDGAFGGDVEALHQAGDDAAHLAAEEEFA